MTSNDGADVDGVFAAGGEMGELMRSIDWSRTAVGPVSGWSEALRTTVGLLLRNRFPMLLWWGPQFIQFYNDAYVPIPGAKHPQAMGQAGPDCWAEIWDVLRPMVEAPFSGKPATWSDDLSLLLNRKGFLEETHFKFAYSPVPDVTEQPTGIGGVLATVAETTEQVYAERQLRTLRELGARAAEAKTPDQACKTAAATFDENPSDVPFALFYLLDAGGKQAHLASSCGFDRDGGPANPGLIELAAAPDEAAWPLGRVVERGQPEVVADLRNRFGALPRGRWSELPHSALVLPLMAPAEARAYGVLIAGLSPHRDLEEGYRTFFELAAAQIVTAIRNAVAYQEERRRAEALAEIDRAKTAFFSNVSHEFRTPLTLMLGPEEDALESPEGVLGGEQLRAVHRNTLRLLKLVNMLLDFSRFEAGRVQASYRPVDLALMTTDLASAFRSAIERGGVRFEVDCPPLAEPVYVDREMWEKIVLNLLSNAFKFTFEGTIAVALHAVGDHVELTVKDTGTGMPEHELPRVFERFHRIEGVRARTHEGSGIGLALVNDLVKLHGGRIEVASQVGAGTTFKVSIPFGRAHLPAERVAAAPTLASTAVGAEPFVAEALRWLPGEPDVATAAGPFSAAETAPTARVLVADDNRDMRDYVTRLLRQRFTVQAVSDGAQALAIARDRPPDLILTDVMMPDLDGFGLLRELRADPRTTSIPVIMLSARAGEESRLEGLEAGADDYLVKPFSAKELLTRVATHLDLGALRRRAEEANRAKDEFLAMLGHELRNPLSPILTAVQLMKMRGHESHEVAVIERQVANLVRLVDDLLDISRITRGKVELRKQRLELAEVVVRGAEMASPLLEQRRQQLDLEVPPDGLLVDGDPDRLAQVVSNLLTNAAKYSEVGTTIHIKAERAGASASLQVRDEGVGIAPGMLNRIFDLFVQQPQSLDRSKGGLGLGLAIVRSLVELHGGHVSASSEGLGKGSEFTVELPLASPGEQRDEPPSTRRGSSTRSRPRPEPVKDHILIVDDNVDGADSIAEFLRELGYEVATAHDGPAALSVARTFRPNICLIDIGLPVMDGYELARRLRASQELPEGARIIALTGYGREGDRRRSSEAGFDAHLVKPVSLDVLTRTVVN
jgi:signal transduction histidine kinase